MAKNGERDEPPRGVSRRELSRRDFLRGSAAVGVLGTGLFRGVLSATPASGAPAAAAQAEAGAPIVGPGAVPMNFRINGKAMSARLEPRLTLLDTLRTRFELTGAKRVCDRGSCGACTVLVDDKAVYACSVLAIEAQDSEIRTVEDLGGNKLHRIQKAFVENDAAQQCGFCAPGFVVAVKGLLERNPTPTPAEIDQGLSGNFCRCGTYAGIRQAVLQLARRGSEDEPEPEPDPSALPEAGEAVAPPEKPRKKKKKKKPGRGGRDGGR